MPPEVGAVFDCIINTIVQYPVGDRRDNIMAAQISTGWHPIFARARRPGSCEAVRVEMHERRGRSDENFPPFPGAILKYVRIPARRRLYGTTTAAADQEDQRKRDYLGFGKTAVTLQCNPYLALKVCF